VANGRQRVPQRYFRYSYFPRLKWFLTIPAPHSAQNMCPRRDLAVEVREYFIPDFSDWKDSGSFEHAFDRLLRDLKAEA